MHGALTGDFKRFKNYLYPSKYISPAKTSSALLTSPAPKVVVQSPRKGTAKKTISVDDDSLSSSSDEVLPLRRSARVNAEVPPTRGRPKKHSSSGVKTKQAATFPPGNPSKKAVPKNLPAKVSKKRSASTSPSHDRNKKLKAAMRAAPKRSS